MTFSPLSQQQILANLINTYSSLIPTADDLNQGSVIRSILTSFAIELKRLYAGAVEDAVDVQRNAAYAVFNFTQLQPTAAYTMLQLNATAPSADTTVPAGSLFGIPGTSIQYQTVADTTWTANSTSLLVRVVCTQTGSIGNTLASTITQVVTPVTGISNLTCTNTKAVITGTDLETDDARAQRFTKYLNTIHRGDLQALQYGALTANIIDDYGYIQEQVMKAQVVEGNGSNSVYIDNGTYDTSSALVTQCQKVINGYTDSNGNYVIGYKAAGIPSTVSAATITQTTVSAKVTTAPGFSLDMVSQTIIDSITSLVEGLNIGDSFTLGALNLAIGNVQGVLNYQITAPTADVVPGNGYVVQLSGTPSITAM